MQTLREEATPLLLMDSGNLFFKDSLLPAEGIPQWKVKARRIVDAYNHMGYHALAIGTVDLALGAGELKELETRSAFPFLSANLREKATGKPPFQPSAIVEITGKKVGILGLTSMGSAAEVSPLEILDPFATAKEMVAHLRPQCNVLVALTTLSASDAERLAEEVEGIDIVIGGTRVDPIASFRRVGKTVVAQSSLKGAEMGVIFLRPDQVAPEESTEGGAPQDWEMVAINSEIDEALEIKDLIEDYKEEIFSLNQSLRAAGEPPGTVPEELRNFVGQQACVECHPHQHQFWAKTSHAHAYDTLVRTKRQFDLDCLPCHTTGYGKAGGYRLTGRAATTTLVSVQCESCHGPGKEHLEGGSIERRAKGRSCMQCHDETYSPHFDEAQGFPKVACPPAPQP